MMSDDERVTASAKTLMVKAPMTVDTYMRSAVDSIDKQFGKGFAKQNPTLVAGFLLSCSVDYATATIAKRLEFLADGNCIWSPVGVRG